MYIMYIFVFIILLEDQPITEKNILEEIIVKMKESGNHKSTGVPENAAALAKLFAKEVEFEWAIPLEPSIIEAIPGVCSNTVDPR